MKILHTVESYYPAIGGMAEVVKQLSERMVKMGHQVTIATKKNDKRDGNPINGVVIKEFNIEGNIVRGITGEVQVYKDFLLNSDFDIVANFAAQQWATDIALPILSEIKGKKVNAPTGFSGLYLSEYKQYFEEMKAWMKGYDANVFLSDNYRDIDFARKNGITKNFLIPNGAAADEFLPESKVDIKSKLGINADSFLILHVGSYTGVKGHIEALKVFLKSKIKNGVLLFVGFQNDRFKQYIDESKRFKLWKLFNPASDKRVIVTSLSREETIAAYKAADLFLFPSNIECSPIVLFESMASETPFLTSEAGNAQEIIEWSGGGMLLPTNIDEQGYSRVDINKSVTLINEVYQNNELRKKMALYGFEAWKDKFTWEKITEKYLAIYQLILSQPS